MISIGEKASGIKGVSVGSVALLFRGQSSSLAALPKFYNLEELEFRWCTSLSDGSVIHGDDRACRLTLLAKVFPCRDQETSTPLRGRAQAPGTELDSNYGQKRG